jgi:Transcriptional regulator/sugar kinase
MSTVKKADQETLKSLNRQIILNHIRRYKEISRVDLTNYTRLSPTTVSTIASELVAKKLVNEIRVGESSGGRKPLMLGINPNGKYAAVIVMTQKGADFFVINLDFKILTREHIKRSINGPDAIEEILSAGIKDMMAKNSNIVADICGLGISIPGVIDHKSGKVLYSSKFRLNDFDMSSVIRKHTSLRNYVFRDTDASILGEYNFGIGSAHKNLVFINIDDGVGMSYINSGKLVQPGYGGGFELGHITIDSNGPLCRCGNRGCLGAVVSEQPIISKLEKLSGKGYETDIGGDVSKLTLADIVEFSNREDKACKYVLEEQARILGTAVASVINLFNPQMVTIGGPLSKCKWGFLDILKDTVKDRALEIFSRNVELNFAKLGNEAALIGMANEIFEREVYGTVALHVNEHYSGFVSV